MKPCKNPASLVPTLSFFCKQQVQKRNLSNVNVSAECVIQASPHLFITGKSLEKKSKKKGIKVICNLVDGH